MNSNSRKYISIWVALFAPILALSPFSTHSAPGTLANTPLFTTTSAEPNIFFMMDDSNSMNTELMTPEYINSWGGIMEICFRTSNCTGATNSYRFVYGVGTDRTNPSLNNSADDEYVIPTQAALDAEVGSGNIDNTTSVQGVWRARNFDYNKQYYDPTKTYTAWASYSEITTETAVPIEPGSGTTFNLTTNKTVESRVEDNSAADYDLTFTYYPATYWVWVDDNSDGVVDATETKKKIEIKAATAVCAGGVSETKANQASGSGCMLRTYATEIDNFANWFAYHRRREFTAKYAVSHVIAPANGVRMGIATIHDDNTNEEKAMTSMVSDITDTDKVAMLTALFNMDTTSSTPLITALEKSGNYFACSGATPFGTGACAIQKTVISPATEAPGVCQQNFTIMVTDGDYALSDTTTTPGDADGDGSSWIAGGTTYQFDGNPYADTNNSNSLADLAMHFYEQDLDGTLANNVPTQCGVDENPGQHMVTFTVGFGVEGNIDPTTFPTRPKLGYASNCTATTGSAFAWTDAGDTTINTFAEVIDDVAHAAYNGRGSYYSANNPDDLVTAINNSMTSISDRKGSAASVSFNSSVLNSSSVLYLGLFNSTNWSGQLLAYSLDASNGNVITPYLWDAGVVLDATSPSSRQILTMGSTDGVAFQWANLTTAQKNDLKTSISGSTENDATGMARLGFLRGDRGCEQGNAGTCSYTDAVPNTYSSKSLRSRAKVLGDIIHSSTVFVGVPELNFPDVAPFPTTSTYSAFKVGSAASRTKIIYAGANDGMLHGFRVSDGQEVLAYIPSNLFSTTTAEGLHYLTNPSYSHRYYVDQTPVISDAYIDSGGGTTAWTTVLVGGERGGGRGLFALDITDPGTFLESGTNPASVVMWEFDSSDDADLGYTFSKPTITLLDNGQWAAIFGNGYNDAAGGDGEAKLFILFLEGGVDGDWTDAGDYIEITTGSGDTTNRNGLSTPTLVDMDGNGTADRVYAGDLNGNMWAFDISGSNTAQWGSAYKTGSTPNPLFTTAANQPITVAPEVVKHPSQPDNSSPSNAPNVMVMFGTGQYLATGDNSTTNAQAFYAVWDEGTDALDTTDLVEQTFETGFASNVRVPTDTTIVWASKFGWYINLGNTGNEGERVISSALARGDLVYFNTLIPSVNPCSLGGDSWFMAVKLENGGRPNAPAFDTSGNNVIDGSDVLTGGSLSGVAAGGTKGDATFGGPQTLADYRYDTSPDSVVPSKGIVQKLDSSDTGRLSWEELPQ